MKKAVLVVLTLSAFACKKQQPAAGGGGTTAGGAAGGGGAGGGGAAAAVTPDSPPAPDSDAHITISDLAPYVDDTNSMALKFDANATKDLGDDRTGTVVARCHEGGKTYKDDLTFDVSNMKKGDSSQQDLSFLELTLAGKPDWCQIEFGYSTDITDDDKWKAVETDCWAGDKVSSGVCPDAVKPFTPAGPGRISIAAETPRVEDENPWIKYEATTNDNVKEGAVGLTVRCNDGSKTYKDDGGEILDHMRAGDTLQLDSVVTNIKLDKDPVWCQYDFSDKDNIFDDTGKPIESICWKGGTNIAKGACN
jgi:hypothetical protein